MKTTSVSKKDGADFFRTLIRDIPNFPKPGIIFKDITPLLKDPHAFRLACDQLGDKFSNARIDQVVGIESRGFILSPAVAYRLNAGFVPMRKKGKLPAEKTHVSYQLEYGEDSLEIHVDAVQKGTRLIIIDDLLATGGTAEAAIRLVEKLGGVVVGLAFLVELEFLKGRERLKNYPVYSLVTYL